MIDDRASAATLYRSRLPVGGVAWLGATVIVPEGEKPNPDLAETGIPLLRLSAARTMPRAKEPRLPLGHRDGYSKSRFRRKPRVLIANGEHREQGRVTT